MEKEKRQDKTKDNYGRVIGMDIHSEHFSAAAFERIGHQRLVEKPLFVHGKVALKDLKPWLLKHSEPGDIFVIEALQNSFVIAKEIKENGRQAVVLESQRAGKIGKSYLKTDKVDAVKLAKIYMSGLAHEVWIPDQKTIERREIFLRYQKTVKDCTRYSNRISGWLMAHKILKPKGMSFSEQRTKEKILSSYNWSVAQKTIIEQMFADFLFSKSKRKELKRIMANEVTSDPDMIKLLRLKGISVINAYALMAIIGDISRFRNPKKLVAYFGLQPRIKESGKTSIKGSISHYGRRDIRALLVQSGHAILRHGDPEAPITKWGWKLSYRKNTNMAALAVARKLVVAVWYLLKGFFTKLAEIDKSLKIKLTKIAVEIGTELRKEMGILDISNFIEIKGDYLMAGS